MKTRFTWFKLLALALIVTSCVHDSLVEEDSSQGSTVSLTYDPNSKVLVQGTSFISEPPEVTGDGPFQYSLTVTPSTPAVSIDAEGKISVTDQLSAGNYSVDVEVQHSGSSTNFKEAYALEVIAAEAITFSNTIQSLFSSKCSNCHTNGPQTNFTNYTNASQNIALILDRVQRDPGTTGFMPLGRQALSQEEINLLLQWQSNGLPE